MLRELHIAGLGVIQDVTLDLAPGLNVLTGETGAGKTMVTVGLSLVLGQRARTGLVRDGADRLLVEALFDAGDLAAAADWAEGGELILARTVTADGRSTARAGGQMTPLSTLADLGADLVEVHGQHQTQRLLSASSQLEFLDRFAGPDHVAALDGYRALHARLRAARAALERLDADAREREREKDLLAYQVREIEGVGLAAGERAQLDLEERRLAHGERILELVEAAGDALSREGGGADALAEAAAALQDVAALDPSARDLAARLGSLSEEARDAAGTLRARAEGLDLDPARLEGVRQRMAVIRDLERKYGEGEEGVLAYLEQSRDRLAELERADDDRGRLQAEVAQLDGEVRAAAGAVTAGRRQAGPRLAEALADELRELGMEDATVEVRLGDPGEPGPDGAEGTDVLFSGGSGQALGPLAKVASGGELSRTMLACRTVLADLDDVGTLVFDEVDAGIGGRAGVAVGRRLARIAERRQVLVVSHLPQIACFADRHFHVSKSAGRATVAALDGDERVAELSRMLSGMPTDEAATHAEQLLAEASREKAASGGRRG